MQKRESIYYYITTRVSEKVIHPHLKIARRTLISESPRFPHELW